MHLIEQFRALMSGAHSGMWGDVSFVLRVFITLPILLVAAFIGFLSMSSAEMRHTTHARDGHGNTRGR